TDRCPGPAGQSGRLRNSRSKASNANVTTRSEPSITSSSRSSSSLMAHAPKAPKDISSLNDDAARRIKNNTAEMASLYEQQQELDRVKWKPMRIARDRPLAAGEVRERDGDLDPQIVWNGVKITLTAEQVKQLGETGSIEIGDAQLVWRGKDTQDWS